MGTRFPGFADFSLAAFSGKANFSNVTFSGKADFSRARFSGNVAFYGVTFSGYAVFFGAELREKARVFFGQINPSSRENTIQAVIYQPFAGFFKGLQLEPGASWLFQDCNLSRVKFAGSDLNRIEFDRITWVSRWGRTAIYDELFWRQKKDGSPESVERLYRQLKGNYEEKKDYKRVGDFHYGEMEMHRLGKPFYGWGSWYWFYWLLNGYGERPLRAFLWVGVFLLTFTGALYWLGLKVVSCGNPASFSETFRFVIDKATLQRPDWARPINEFGHWLAATTVFIIPGQLALFFLALRNRLGRRR